MSEDTILEVQGISKSYGSVKALKDVSFCIERGEVHGLVGENGAGKSTLIKILSAAVKADRGQILFNGREYNPENPAAAFRKGISTIYQVFNLLPDHSVMRNIFLGKETKKWIFLDLDTMRRETSEILENLGVKSISPEDKVGSLRVGEMQIIEIAKALRNNIKLMIMDEPTSTLNQFETESLFNLIRSFKDRGITTLYISHHLDEIFKISDRVTILRDGKFIHSSDTKDINEADLIYYMTGRREKKDISEKIKPQSTVLVETRNISCGKYVKRLSFTLHRGEITAFAGLTGCGKTEIAKALWGVIPISEGELYCKGEPLSPSPWNSKQKGIMLLPEDRKNDGLLQSISIKRNISLSVLDGIVNMFGILNLRKELEIVKNNAEALQIKAKSFNETVQTLSGGNQQKVVLARCLATEPDIFVLLEPTQGIDVGVKFEIYRFIKDQAKQGKGIILVSSDIAEILALAHKVYVLYEGEVSGCFDGKEATRKKIVRASFGMAK